jgi:hypothetical protein
MNEKLLGDRLRALAGFAQALRQRIKLERKTVV